MAGLPHLIGQHLREAAECVARGATAGSRVRLLRDTVRFHLRNRLAPGARQGGANRYDVRIASRRVELHLRPYAGDFFVFHEIFVDRPYAIPAAWQRDVRTVVDLGAHVGLTSLFFLEQLPQARLVCVEAAPDKQGRVMLPPTLVAHAKLGREVIVAGVHDHVEIWDRATWRKHLEEVEGSAELVAERLAEKRD